MEAIVNYSSEDEQDELNAQSGADRGGSPYRTKRLTGRTGSGSSASSYSPHRSAANGASASNAIGKSNPNGNNNTGRNSNYHRSEENSQKYRTWSAPNRSANYSRDGGNGDRYRRDDDTRHYDARERERGSRDSREYKNNTTLQHERNRGTKDFRDEYKRDNGNYRDNRRPLPRDEDRNYHHNRHSFSSTSAGMQYKDRYSGNGREERQRYSDSSARHQYHNQRGRDERDHRSNRYDKTDRSRMRYHHHHHTRDSRSRTRSRSNSKERMYAGSSESIRQSNSKPIELARQSAMEMERKLNVTNDKLSDTDKSPKRVSAPVPGRKLESLLSLPLNDNAPKQPNVIAITPVYSASSSAHASAAAPMQTAEPSVIQLPSYYNPCVINPTKYAEQVQKRKLLWGAKKNEDTTAKWNNAQFSQDTDGKVASKFMRLMGIKGSGGSASSHKDEPSPEVEPKAPVPAPDMRSREEMFSSMEQQYEVARQATHTMRGVGLGFSSQARPF